MASEVCGKASAIMREKTERESSIVTPGTKKPGEILNQFVCV
jgi:hypothetical protein